MIGVESRGQLATAATATATDADALANPARAEHREAQASVGARQAVPANPRFLCCVLCGLLCCSDPCGGAMAAKMAHRTVAVGSNSNCVHQLVSYTPY